ncbi:hypothetical protein EPR50_G00202290 [Perca flavescens]|uniref:F-box domain-containing protein n=1 Tax=Perca flavescens TaxID=8167 RepID=A0A484C4A2_PERFV|nr:F-box only protein 33-like [Perca flavescens]TDG98621.1 hypothetical protein EPR50_G00202290 [Perca flavescens]
MALCGVSEPWLCLASLSSTFFSFLSDRDKLRASAVCSRWRECLFYPALWTELKLRIGGGCNGGGSSSEETPRLEFLMRKFGSFVRELQLELAPVEGCLSPLNNNNPSSTRMDQPDSDPQLSQRWRDAMATYLDQVLCVFSSIRNNRNLRKLSLYGDTCVLQQEGLLDSSHLHQIHQGDKKINE